MDECYVQIVNKINYHHRWEYIFDDYESAINYIAQNPLSSAAEEYRIGVPYYDNEGWLVDIAYLDPSEFSEDVEKVRKGETLSYDNRIYDSR